MGRKNRSGSPNKRKGSRCSRKRPSAKHKLELELETIRLFERRQQSNLKAREVQRQRAKEYRLAA